MKTTRCTRAWPIVIVGAFVGGSCGGSDGAEPGAVAPDTVAATTVSAATDTATPEVAVTTPPPTAPTTEAPSSTTEAVTTAASPSTEAPTTTVAIEDVPFPAAALPILDVHEMDQSVWSLQGFDDELVFAHGLGIGRLDIDDGSVTTRSIALGQERRAEIFYSVSDGSNYVAVADAAGQGTLDVLATIDAQTLDRTATHPPGPFGQPMLRKAIGTPSMTIAREGGSWFTFDASTAEVGAEIEFLRPFDVATSVDGELWAWTLDGTLQVFSDAGDVLGVIETGHTFAMFASSLQLVTPTSVWLQDAQTAELLRVDRASLELTTQIDLREHLSWADAVKIRVSNSGGPFVLANAVNGEGGWWMLIEIDPETGDIVSEHVIATDALDYGWNAFDAPDLARVGDRLFVRDHRRRIVEVDVDALAVRSATAWVDAGIGRAPTLSDDEQVIADLALRIVDGDPETLPPLTDPERGLLALDTLGASVTPDQIWEACCVELVDDRASARVAPVGEIGAYFVFRRVDDTWHVDSDALCELARNAGNPCQI